MTRNRIPALLCFLLLLIPVSLHAQAWSGILSPSRAVDWSQVGVTGGIPTTRTQCVTSACRKVTAAGASATARQIQDAISSAPKNSYVLLAAGTYTRMPSTTSKAAEERLSFGHITETSYPLLRSASASFRTRGSDGYPAFSTIMRTFLFIGLGPDLQLKGLILSLVRMRLCLFSQNPHVQNARRTLLERNTVSNTVAISGDLSSVTCPRTSCHFLCQT